MQARNADQMSHPGAAKNLPIVLVDGVLISHAQGSDQPGLTSDGDDLKNAIPHTLTPALHQGGASAHPQRWRQG
jgi:hypothetical protein